MAQKRSSNTYQKINTLFKRDDKNIIILDGSFVSPEFEVLRGIKWEATEKIDGTNIRIEVQRRIEYQVEIVNNVEYEETDIPIGVHFDVTIKGKTDNANIPTHLLTFLQEKYPSDIVLNSLGLKEFIPVEEFAEHRWVNEKGEIDVSRIPNLYTIYGEGYGMRIQSGGNYIKNGVGFIVFDVKVNDTYLLTENYRGIAEKMGAPCVPDMGMMTIDEAIEFVKKGFKSTIAENKDYDAEGLVLKAPLGLRTRMGERLIVKIKTCDFRKYEQAYGK